jgi:hypothetical protein
MQKFLPPKSHKRPCKESFRVEPTKLNLKACPFEDYPEAPKTERMEKAVVYISRMHCTDVELQEMDASTPPPTSQS